MSKDGDRGPQLLLTLCMSEKDGVVQEALGLVIAWDLTYGIINVIICYCLLHVVCVHGHVGPVHMNMLVGARGRCLVSSLIVLYLIFETDLTEPESPRLADQ